jgi:uncharacterized Zn-finger protein
MNTYSSFAGGSGEFVPEKKWSCSQHSHPQYHDCDCEHCDRYWECDECSTAQHVETGEMREASNLEVMLRNIYMPRAHTS